MGNNERKKMTVQDQRHARFAVSKLELIKRALAVGPTEPMIVMLRQELANAVLEIADDSAALPFAREAYRLSTRIGPFTHPASSLYDDIVFEIDGALEALGATEEVPF